MNRKMFFGALAGIVSTPFIDPKSKTETISLKIEVDTREAMAELTEIKRLIKETERPIVTMKDFIEIKAKLESH